MDIEFETGCINCGEGAISDEYPFCSQECELEYLACSEPVELQNE